MTSSGLVLNGEEVPLFVINLDSRPERWDAIQRRLAVHGLRARRFSALTAGDATARGYRICLPRAEQPEWRVGHGALGCAASHIEIYRQISQGGSQGAVIFEDDALLENDFTARAQAALQNRSSQTALLSLGWLFYRSTARTRVADAANRLRGSGPTRDRLAFQPFGMGSHCYWVSREFAAAAPELMAPVFAPVDAMLRAFTHYASWQSEIHWPPLATQDTSPSDIQVEGLI